MVEKQAAFILMKTKDEQAGQGGCEVVVGKLVLVVRKTIDLQTDQGMFTVSLSLGSSKYALKYFTF